MNTNILRALFQDSLQQVIDNKVFRLLVILVLVMIGLTFLFQIREDSISFLWIWEYPYREVVAVFGLPLPDNLQPGEFLIKSMQEVFIEWFAGVAGIVFCVAATAFFVPRMLQKGAADMIFSKPISRTTLLVMRYFSGLLFVGVLSFTLVGGMYSGFAISSGYTDTGFLWSAVTLIYLYAILQAFSALIGTVTRSSVAAMLAVLILFPVSSCTHWVWERKQWAQEQEWSSLMDALDADVEEEEEEGDEEELEGVLYLLDSGFSAFHYLLPKTRDASLLTSMLRGAIEGWGPALRDAEGMILVEFQKHPEGMVLMGSSTPDFKDPVAWVPKDPKADSRMRVFLTRRDRNPKSETGERSRRLHASRVANALVDELDEREERDELLVGPEKLEEADHWRSRGSMIIVRWKEGSERDPLQRTRIFFQVPAWLYEVDLTVPQETMDDEAYQSWEEDFLDGIYFGPRFPLPKEWYEEQFGWDSPWRYNAFFSIGTSLAFALLCLAASAFRLNRHDF